MAIQSIASVETKLKAVYGFGSAFRGESFRDIDILAVVGDDQARRLDAYYELRAALEIAVEEYGRPIHLTMLTEPEFRSRPLRDMNQLVMVWRGET